MRKILLVAMMALLCGAAVQAQEVEARIFQIEHADVEALARVLTVFKPDLSFNDDLKTISVRGTPETLAAIEEAIARFDVPPEPQKNVVLTFHMLRASQTEGTMTPLPVALQDVAEQLKTMFGYRAFYLLDTAVLRIRDGMPGNMEGAVSYPGTDPDHPASYDLSFRRPEVSGDGEAPSVRLNALSLQFLAPYQQTSRNDDGVEMTRWVSRRTRINTDIDVREGQKVVVGKASLDAEGNHLILVVTADVVD